MTVNKTPTINYLMLNYSRSLGDLSCGRVSPCAAGRYLLQWPAGYIHLWLSLLHCQLDEKVSISSSVLLSLFIQIVVNRPSERVPTETLWLKRHSSSAQTNLALSYTEVQSAGGHTRPPICCHKTHVHGHTHMQKHLVSVFMFNGGISTDNVTRL